MADNKDSKVNLKNLSQAFKQEKLASLMGRKKTSMLKINFEF